MTNTQLAVLLSQYARRLESEIQALDGRLPDGVSRHLSRHYIGPEIKGFLSVEFMLDRNYEMREDGPAVMLEELRDLLTDLKTDIAALCNDTPVDAKEVADETG